MDSTSKQVVIVPSTRDAHHDPCFPQPPFSAGIMPAPGLSLAPNPCTIRVNDCVIGVCAGMVQCLLLQFLLRADAFELFVYV